MKTLSSDVRDMDVASSFLMAKKGIGAVLVPQGQGSAQMDSLWLKLVDTMRLEAIELSSKFLVGG